jgi:hypothetical protein
MRAPLCSGSPVFSRVAGLADTGFADTGVGAAVGAGAAEGATAARGAGPVFEDALEASGLLTLDPILKMLQKRNS